MERIWGGHRLASLFGKKTPPTATIGESWEIVDRPEAQSVVRNGSFRDRTLHELWTHDRKTIFGDVPEGPRFPLLIKLLDAHDNFRCKCIRRKKSPRNSAANRKRNFG